MRNLRLESQSGRKFKKIKSNFFSLDSNVIKEHLKNGDHEKMFENSLNLCVSPTVYAEIRGDYKPPDFEDRVKSFPDLCSCLSLEFPEECVIEGVYSMIMSDTLTIKARSIRREMYEKRIWQREKRDEYFKRREKEDWIEKQDFRILAETFCMREELAKRGKEMYFVTHDISMRKYVPENILEIVTPETLYN